MNSTPDGTKGVLKNRSVYEIAIAPSSTNRFYMFIDGNLFRSDDHCSAWILANFPKDTTDFTNAYPENDPHKTMAAKWRPTQSTNQKNHQQQKRH